MLEIQPPKLDGLPMDWDEYAQAVVDVCNIKPGFHALSWIRLQLSRQKITASLMILFSTLEKAVQDKSLTQRGHGTDSLFAGLSIKTANALCRKCTVENQPLKFYRADPSQPCPDCGDLQAVANLKG